MSKVQVYFFTRYDIKTDKLVRSLRPATREAIATVSGNVIEASEQEVESSTLDDNGFLIQE